MMPPREASSSKGVVNSFPTSVTKTFKGPAVTNLRAPLTGVSSAERPPAERPPAQQPPPANDDSAQSPSEGSSTSVVPASPLTSPEDSHFYQRSGGASMGASVNSGVNFAPLLLALLFSVIVLFRRDGRFWHLSWYLPKPTSVLLLPLERPG